MLTCSAGRSRGRLRVSARCASTLRRTRPNRSSSQLRRSQRRSYRRRALARGAPASLVLRSRVWWPAWRCGDRGKAVEPRLAQQRVGAVVARQRDAQVVVRREARSTSASAAGRRSCARTRHPVGRRARRRSDVAMRRQRHRVRNAPGRLQCRADDSPARRRRRQVPATRADSARRSSRLMHDRTPGRQLLGVASALCCAASRPSLRSAT